MTLAEREKREPTYWPTKPCEVASTSPPSPALAPLPPELVTPLTDKRGVFGGERVLLQPLGRNFGVVEKVEIRGSILASRAGSARPW